MAEKNKASKKATKKKKMSFHESSLTSELVSENVKRLVGQHGSTQQEISALFLS